MSSLFQPLFTHFEEGIIAKALSLRISAGQKSYAVSMTRRIVAGGLGNESRCALFQILLKERFQLLKRNDIHLIVEVGMAGTGDNEQFLVVPSQLAVHGFAEIA